MPLTLATALTNIEQALQRVIRLDLQQRRSAVATIAALRAVPAQGASGPAIKDGDPLRYVTAVGACYDWSAFSSAVDNGTSVIRPTDIDAGKPGRWLLTTSTVTSGYLKSVILWNGEFRRKEFESRIYADRPCVAIMWEGSRNAQRSTVAGAIFDYEARFTILCVSANLRDEQQTVYGSAISAEAAADPGAVTILGAVKKTLADENKRADEKLDLGGSVKQINLGEEGIEDVDLDERRAIISLDVSVMCSIENADDAATEHKDVDAIYAQAHRVVLNEQAEFDDDNYVASGYTFAAGALTQTPASGSAVVGGITVSSAPAQRTFGARTDTYRDLKLDGTFAYHEVANGLDEPDVTTGALRVGVTVTDSTSVIYDRMIAATKAAIGPNNEIPTP